MFLARPASAQTLPYSGGDLIMAFRTTGSSNASTDVELDIGNASLFTSGGADSTGGIVSITTGNINTDLTSLYGASWNTSASTLWSISGSPGSSADGSIAADSMFATRAESVPGTQSTPWLGSAGLGAYNGSSLKIFSMGGGAAGYATGANTIGQSISTNNTKLLLQGTSTGDSYASFVSANSAFTYFNGTGGIEGNLGNGITGSVLDLYQLTPGTSTVNMLGGFELTNGGLEFSSNISNFNTSTVPEPSTYAGLLGLATLGFVALRRRKQVKA
jgi:hypothetical protein